MKKLLAALLIFLPCLSYAQGSTRWRITKPQWTDQDENKFGEFISKIGAAVERRECLQVDTCLKSTANPYAGTDPSSLRLFADCADLPYFLRAYFAWKNGLPLSVQSDVSPRQSGDNPDVRYTKYGNYVTGRYSVIPTRFSSPNAIEILNKTVVDMVWSASFRLIGEEDTGYFTDFYPVKLSREGIRPGTVIYDPNGHVAIIYKVTDDGRIFYIDSHPDNTLTSGMYTPKFTRSFPQQGAGFKNFRPLALVGANRNVAGEYIGGRIVGARNSALPNYSLEQFYGNRPDPSGDWQKGQFIYRGAAFPYYEYLRIMMASGDLKIDPLRDMQQNLADICTSLKDRVVAVSLGNKAGIDKKPHPERLPQNIYGTDGEWEAYASPARDARLKVSYMDLLSQARILIQRHRTGDPSIVYSGANLAADMLAVYDRETRGCQFTYTNSSGGAVTLNSEDARQRLFDLSFDPYHCVELRWGAKSPQELASCMDDANKREWYSRERWLRNQWERRYDARMDFSLDELTGPKPGAGIAQPPDVDIIRYLNSQK
ncbi:hypothetical protein [Bdellovibrio sp. BCCA]|uniref:hypothetical protein n=1 Tax=Bdellovibrio sp. BCCA TaxID=3136281 RepID=UPI0030F2B6BD